MIFDGIVFGAYISGSILIFLFTLLRYSIGTDKSGKIMRLINAIKVVSLREKTGDSFGMLIQYTGALFLLLGTVYGIILKRYVVEGILEDCLIFLVFFSPGVLLIGVTVFLRRFYWRRPN